MAQVAFEGEQSPFLLLPASSPGALDLAAVALLVDAAALRGAGGTGGAAGLRTVEGGAEDLPHPEERFAEVALAVAGAVAQDGEDAVLREAGGEQRHRPGLLLGGQQRRSREVEAHLGPGLDLVDVLAPGPAGAGEADVERRRRDHEPRPDADLAVAGRQR